MNLPARYSLTESSPSGGGMGDIHECIDNHLGRRVVLKMLKQDNEIRRLIDEQRALIKLRSKHVVQLYDVITVQDHATPKNALVLEHISGEDLAVGSVEPGKPHVETLWQIACGLVDIHCEGIIHRDLKPHNIRVNADGVVKILDFGLARNTGPDASTLNIIGTPGFMAPELWSITGASFDQSIDVYAFGMTALALIDFPVPAELLERPPRPLRTDALSELAPDLPNDIISLIEASLSTDPRKRPHMKEIEVALRRRLLYNRHRALLILGGKAHEINASTLNVTVRSGTLGAIGIRYDGFCFRVSGVTGAVSVNNSGIIAGELLPDCCVITFGDKMSGRSFVTFDVSNPEVVA